MAALTDATIRRSLQIADVELRMLRAVVGCLLMDAPLGTRQRVREMLSAVSNAPLLVPGDLVEQTMGERYQDQMAQYWSALAADRTP